MYREKEGKGREGWRLARTNLFWLDIEPVDRKPICKTTLTQETKDAFANAIYQQYWFSMFIGKSLEGALGQCIWSMYLVLTQ